MYVLQDWTFTPGAPGAGTIEVPGLYSFEQFAVITNLTRNVALFDPADPTLAATWEQTLGGTTILTLAQPTEFCQSSDPLQILMNDLYAGGGTGPASNVAVTNWPTSQNVNGTVEISNDVGDPIGVTVSNFPATQPISGTVTANQGTSPWVVSGTVVTTPQAVATFDAFGRQRISSGYTLADYSSQYGMDFTMLPETSGTGSSVTYPANQACARLTSGTGATDFARRQSQMYHNYQPGKSQLIFASFNFVNTQANASKRIGYFDGRNGIYLQQSGTGDLSFVQRSYVSGVVVETPFPQGPSWNVDPCDGTGPSGFDLDPTKTQLLFLDFQWLGVGRIRIGFVHDGNYVIALDIPHSNTYDTVYWSLPGLPLRAEVVNSGVLSSPTYMDMICGTVLSEGGYDEVGDNFSVSTAIRTIGASGTSLPVAAIRLKNSFNGYPNRAYVRLDNLEVIAPDNTIRIQLVRLDSHTTITGGTWVSAHNDSKVEYNITPTGFTPNGDQIINQFFLASGGVGGGNNTASPLNVTNPSKARRGFIAQNINSNNSMAYLVYATSFGAGATAAASVQWREIG